MCESQRIIFDVVAPGDEYITIEEAVMSYYAEQGPPRV